MKHKVLITALIIILTGVFVGNWVYGTVLSKKIEKQLISLFQTVDAKHQLEFNKVKVNPLLSKLQIKGFTISTLQGQEVISGQELILDMPYSEVMRLLNDKKVEELKSLKLKVADLSVYVEGANDSLLVNQLLIDFDGHLLKADIENIQNQFPESKQELMLQAKGLRFAQTPWMNNLGFTEDQIKEFNWVEELKVDLSFNPNKQEFKVADLHMLSPLMNCVSEGTVKYAGNGLANVKTTSVNSAFKLELNNNGIEWGDPSTTGRFAIDKLMIDTESAVSYAGSSPVIQSQASDVLLENFSVEFSGDKKAQLEASAALLGLKLDKVNIKRLSIQSNMENNAFVIKNTELKSSLLNAELDARIQMNEQAPGASQIEYGTLIISDLVPGLQNALSTFELVTGQSLPRKGKAIVLEMSGAVSRPNIKGLKY